LDEKVWAEKYMVLPQSNFRWKAPWMNDTICIMSCGNKIWVPLVGVTRYISYEPALVARQLKGCNMFVQTSVIRLGDGTH
jgi:hypothetical protein